MTRPAPLFGDDTWNDVWALVCRHIDGLSVGSSVAALQSRGVLAELAGPPGRRNTVSKLAARHAANPGFLLVAARLLADQDWLVLDGDADDPQLVATSRGREMFAFAGCYALALGFLTVAESRLAAVLDGHRDPAELVPWLDRVSCGWDLPTDLEPAAREVLRAHLDGHVIGPVMAAIARRRLSSEDERTRPTGPFAERSRELVGQLLQTQGWADAATGELTPAGVIAHRCAAQYWYPVTYVHTLRHVPEMIFGRPGAAAEPDSDDAHLDRELDLRFSAEVFRATCRTPVLETVRVAFTDLPLERQPSAVIDIGCGDGTVLRAIWDDVVANTPRGGALERFPLRMVGVEPSPIGRELTEQALTSAGAPALTLPGDVGAPAALAAALREHGVDPEDALWVTKSVIHDRDYRAEDADAGLGTPPAGAFGYPNPDGSVIRAADMASSLVTLLRRWTPLIARHGFVVVEAHQAPSPVIVANLGRSVNTALDATHGYSCQYPLPPAVFAWATERAGWHSVQHAEPGAQRLGYVTLTVDRFLIEA